MSVLALQPAAAGEEQSAPLRQIAHADCAQPACRAGEGKERKDGGESTQGHCAISSRDPQRQCQKGGGDLVLRKGEAQRRAGKNGRLPKRQTCRKVVPDDFEVSEVEQRILAPSHQRVGGGPVAPDCERYREEPGEKAPHTSCLL